MLSLGSFTALSARREAATKKQLRDTRTDGPAHVGRYTLVSRIGEGGMAEIYSAVTTGVGAFRRPVVIKRLKPELAADPAAVAQFRDEANLLAAFNHPNIVAVHDFGQWENRFFLAEEYVAGRNLGQIIDQCFRARSPASGAGAHRVRRARGPEGARLRPQAGDQRGAPAQDCPPRHLARERCHHRAG